MPWDTEDHDVRNLIIVGAEAPADGEAPVLHPADQRRVWAFLGLRDMANRARVEAAIIDAVSDRRSDLMIIGSIDEPRTIVTIRPAREDGFAVVASEPLAGAAERLDVQGLRPLFHLSHSEAEVAIALVRGASLFEIALDRGVQHETVRGQVKTLLRKVGVHNQKQLTAVLCHVGALADGITRRRVVPGS